MTGSTARDTKLSLMETVTWCAPRAVAARAGTTTRSQELKAPLFELDAETQLDTLMRVPNAARDTVDFIVQRRRAALSAEGVAVWRAEGLAGGRVFATDFDTDICCAATVPSNGFVDDYDITGWDTWFAHVDTGKWGGVVYGWVPPALLQLADRGFDAVPVQSIWWVDDSELQRLLSAA